MSNRDEDKDESKDGKTLLISLFVILLAAFLGSGWVGSSAKGIAIINAATIKDLDNKTVKMEQFREFKEANLREHDALYNILERIEDKIDKL